MIQKTKYPKHQPQKHLGVLYRIVQCTPDIWHWETRKWFIWSRYPHAMYDSYSDADTAAKNIIKWCADGYGIF